MPWARGGTWGSCWLRTSSTWRLSRSGAAARPRCFGIFARLSGGVFFVFESAPRLVVLKEDQSENRHHTHTHTMRTRKTWDRNQTSEATLRGLASLGSSSDQTLGARLPLMSNFRRRTPASVHDPVKMASFLTEIGPSPMFEVSGRLRVCIRVLRTLIGHRY